MVQLIPPNPHWENHKQSLVLAQEKLEEASRSHHLLSDRGRVMIFIDGSSLFYAAMQLDIEIDYMRLLRFLAAGGRLVHAFFYTGLDPFNEKQKGFLHWMQCNGYKVITKELVQFADGSKKANLNVEIAVDMLTLSPHCDTMVLISGTGELTYAVNAITYQGVQTEVMSLQSMTSDSLINVADYYTDLAAVKQEIQKLESARKRSS